MTPEDTPRVFTIHRHSDGREELLGDAFPVHRMPFLEGRGWQGGGHSWGEIGDALAELHLPGHGLRFDCEAGLFVAMSDDAKELRALAELLNAACHDDALFRAALAWAEDRGQME